jgi:hypothetical protein
MMNNARLRRRSIISREISSVFVGIIWLNQIDMTDAERLRELKKRHDRWIPPATLQATDVLLAESGTFLDLLLGQALVLTDTGKVSAHQLAHVHARSDGGL